MFHYMNVKMCVFIISPALLQSTVKLFFCPTEALDSPVPRQTTLLASDVSLVEVEVEELLYAPPTLEVLVTVSTKTEEVSWRLCPPDSLAPAGQREISRLSKVTVA